MLVDSYMREKIKWSQFINFMELEKGCLDIIPAKPGVYSIWRSQKDKIKFMKRGTGSRFRGNPNVPIRTLEKKLVNEAEILYIGKADSLMKRIKQLIRFGKGKPAPHRGGRYIW